MKELLENFKKENPIPNIYISYGKMRDLNADVTTLNDGIYLIYSTSERIHFRNKTSTDMLWFKECSEEIELNNKKYIYEPLNLKGNDFILLFDLENLDFKLIGEFNNQNRAKILKVLNRITNINKGIKKIEKEYKEKGINFLKANYPWLHFSIHREDELHFAGKLIGDFVILYPNGVWEIDSTIEKSFERAMKRILKYK